MGLFDRLKQGLTKTKKGFVEKIDTIFRDRGINDETLEELEETLILSDIGAQSAGDIIEHLREQASKGALRETASVKDFIKNEMASMLGAPHPFVIYDEKPFVILAVGVNGVGKTTTIGKLANRLREQGHSVLIAAADTFRAAAIEQLEIWAERSHSGRLHTKTSLMEELKKIKRVCGKAMAGAPHEILLVVDATNGQNALKQAQMFHDAVGVTGIALTKLDGTAKGGIVFAIIKEQKIPVKLIGVGEGSMKKFEFIDISGDAGIRVFGNNLTEIFSNAAIALYTLITDISHVDTKKNITVSVESPSSEGLLVSWLNELIFHFDTYGFIGKDITDITLTPSEQKMDNERASTKGHKLSATVAGEDFNRNKHEGKLLLKAATYHNLKIEKIGNLWEADIIFDI
jgi:fused signal recognition particle receptor